MGNVYLYRARVAGSVLKLTLKGRLMYQSGDLLHDSDHAD